MNDFEAAVSYLKGNKVRLILTVGIIAVGIMSLVGIQTAVAVMTESIAGAFSKMGSNLLSVEPLEGRSPIGVRDAERFSENAGFAQIASVWSVRSSIARIRSSTAVTDPVVTVIASDERYLDAQFSDIAVGRNFTSSDILHRRAVALVGENVRKRLFRGKVEGESILVCGKRYSVAGVIRKQGAMFGTGLDNSVIVPLENDRDCIISFLPAAGVSSVQAETEAKLLMRRIRALGPSDETDFAVVRADTIHSRMESIRSKLSVAALLSGLLTLLGSTVGLMNIMLVSVKERTREIGTRKALGARNSDIVRQFLAESVLIGQAGGAAGIVLGVLSGNVVALLMEGSFTVPWGWLAASVILCLGVSFLSGILPARRAAALDPIEALRDE